VRFLLHGVLLFAHRPILTGKKRTALVRRVRDTRERGERNRKWGRTSAMRKTTNVSEAENLWKAAGQAALIGLAGAAAMLATEMMLFPGLVRAGDAAVSCSAACGANPAVSAASAGPDAGN